MMSERRRAKLSNTSKVVSESCILRIQTAMFKDHLINQRKIFAFLYMMHLLMTKG